MQSRTGLRIKKLVLQETSFLIRMQSLLTLILKTISTLTKAAVHLAMTRFSLAYSLYLRAKNN